MKASRQAKKQNGKKFLLWKSVCIRTSSGLYSYQYLYNINKRLELFGGVRVCLSKGLLREKLVPRTRTLVQRNGGHQEKGN